MSNQVKLVPKNHQPQQPFDIKDAQPTICSYCQHEFFEQAFRLGVISKMMPSNSTGINIVVNSPVFICKSCGQEYKYNSIQIQKS